MSLAVINSLLLGLTQENLVPLAYAHAVALASLVVASFMKNFGSSQTAVPAPVVAPVVVDPAAVSVFEVKQ